MGQASQARWALAGTGGCRVRRWDDEAVVYHRASGGTHLVDEASCWLLLRLQSGPVALDALAEGLREEIGAGSREQLVQITQARLNSLQSLGIVVSLPGDSL